jgi:hypothetical protein
MPQAVMRSRLWRSKMLFTAKGGVHRQPGATPQGFVQRPNPTALKAQFIPGSTSMGSRVNYVLK